MINDYYSQAGEDAFLAKIFEGVASGTCLEVGALDGIKDSTTLHFEQKGWRCILVEANPELAEKARTNRTGPVFACAAGRASGKTAFFIAKGAEYLSTTVGSELNIARMLKDGAKVDKVEVSVRPVDDMLLEFGISKLDFATIDVEGAELDVLQGFDLSRWKPKVLVLEDNSGGQDQQVSKHLRAKGYRRFYNDGLNNWYAEEGDGELLTAENMTKLRKQEIRARIFRWTFGWMPIGYQTGIVHFKRKWFKHL